ncbi:MAG: acyl-CoA dehydrogenase family protein [Caldilineales bacterium]|nr:acyl-CoA dehydrogenase family protein [Caldilineales bacterium]
MYSFDMTDEQRMLTDAVNRYATRTLRQVYRQAEAAGEVPDAAISAGWELGLLPASIPEALGGFGDYARLTGALYAEELGYGDMAAALHLLSPNLVAIPLLLGGTEAQQQQYLPLFCDAAFPKATAAFLEPALFFDPENLQTTARRAGDAYILDGRKTMVINAAEAEWLLVYANEEGQTQAFLLPAPTPGLHIGKRDHWMGLHALKTYGVELAGVHVPAQNRIGGEQGIAVQQVLNSSRIALSALAIGLARGAYDYARDYAKERMAFGEPIAHRQSIAFMLADMAIEIDAARLLTWEAAWKLDAGKEATHDAYLAAQYAADMALKVTDGAVQVLGGHGYIREHPVELWLRNGRGIAAMLGAVIV